MIGKSSANAIQPRFLFQSGEWPARVRIGNLELRELEEVAVCNLRSRWKQQVGVGTDLILTRMCKKRRLAWPRNWLVLPGRRTWNQFKLWYKLTDPRPHLQYSRHRTLLLRSGGGRYVVVDVVKWKIK